MSTEDDKALADRIARSMDGQLVAMAGVIAEEFKKFAARQKAEVDGLRARIEQLERERK